MDDVFANRPWGLVLAATCGVLLGVLFIVLAVLSAASGHGVFSAQIGVLLAGYGLLLGAAAIGLWQRRRWARGPAVACALLVTFGFGQFLPNQPWSWIPFLLGLAVVVGGVLPATTRALRPSLNDDEKPQQTARR